MLGLCQIFILLVMAAANVVVSCSPPWQRIGRECFWMSQTQHDWNSARQECEKMNSSLAEPQDLELLRSYLNSNELEGDYWLGGWRWNSSFSWEWQSGRPILDAFELGTGNRGPGPACLDFQSNKSPSLNGFKCDNDQFFICEGSVTSEEVTDTTIIPQPTPTPVSETTVLPDFFSGCSSISSCSVCVSAPSCDWCLAAFKCTGAYDNTCHDTDVVVYAHNPNGTNIGKRFRNGPSFCPIIYDESEWIKVFNTNKTSSSFRVDVKSIPKFMQNFTCELDWEENLEIFHSESLGRITRSTRDAGSEYITCQNMEIPEINTSEVTANFTIKFRGNAIDSPDNKSALIFNCLYLSSNCEECASLESPYNCAWCIPTETCLNDAEKCLTDNKREEVISSYYQIENCPASPKISSLEWCEFPMTTIGSECFFISNIMERRYGDAPTDMTWNDAKRFCQKSGSDLAQPFKIKALKEYFDKSENGHADTSKYWIGGSRTHGNSYVWSSGDIVRRDWVKSSEEADYNCLQYDSGQWSPFLIGQNCNVTQPWICENSNPYTNERETTVIAAEEPHFESPEETTVVVEEGSTASLLCTVKQLGNKTLSWVRLRDETLLTVATFFYTMDMRFQSVHPRDSDLWTLQILHVRKSDQGMYECQVSSRPVKRKLFKLTVVAIG